MATLNVQEAKTHLSRYLDRVAKGEVIVVCKYNKPVAEIRAIPETVAPKPRKPGLWKGQFTLGPEFFAPLPDELMAYFEGEKP